MTHFSWSIKFLPSVIHKPRESTTSSSDNLLYLIGVFDCIRKVDIAVLGDYEVILDSIRCTVRLKFTGPFRKGWGGAEKKRKGENGARKKKDAHLTPPTSQKPSSTFSSIKRACFGSWR